MKMILIRTKTEYVMKPTEYRDYKDYWITRLIYGRYTHFQKHNQHGIKSPVFKIVSTSIVYSPVEYLDACVLHTKMAIKLVGIEETERGGKIGEGKPTK